MSRRPGGGVGTTITQHLKVRPLSKPPFGNRVSEHSVTLLHYGGPPPGHSLLVVVLNQVAGQSLQKAGTGGILIFRSGENSTLPLVKRLAKTFA